MASHLPHPSLPPNKQPHSSSATSSSTLSILLFLNLAAAAVTCPPFFVTSWSKLGFCAMAKSCVQYPTTSCTLNDELGLLGFDGFCCA